MTAKPINKSLYKSEEQKIIEQILKSRDYRIGLTETDLTWFFTVYFSDYIRYKTATFQKEIFSLISNENIPIVAITAFRGSGKSTLCALVLPIWAIIGRWRKKYVVIVCQNQQRAKEVMANIRSELMLFGLLSTDFNPREGKPSKWSENTIVIPKYKARITVLSTGENMRGIRHLQHRPSLIIADDLEDVPSAQSSENRKKLRQFVFGELMPAGDKDTRYIFIGNKVHNDSLMMNLKESIESGHLNGVYKEYPLISSGEIIWPGKYADKKAISSERAKFPSKIDYLREMMLMILPDGDAIVKPGDIKNYDNLPDGQPEFFFISVDPAFSEKTTADFTAIVFGAAYRVMGKLKLYIHPNPTNKRMKLHKTIEEIKRIKASFGDNAVVKIFVEGGASQGGLVDMLKYQEGMQADSVSINGQDKKSRLHAASAWLQNETILFPKEGVDDLENQIYYFGTEKHDDLADALTLLAIALLSSESSKGVTPIAVKTTGLHKSMTDSLEDRYSSTSFNSHKQDWVDIDDQKLFRKLKMRNSRRIYG